MGTLLDLFERRKDTLKIFDVETSTDMFLNTLIEAEQEGFTYVDRKIYNPDGKVIKEITNYEMVYRELSATVGYISEYQIRQQSQRIVKTLTERNNELK